MATQTQRTVNGVDVRALKETITAVQEKPQLADFEFRAVNQWVSGGHNRTTVRDFYGAGQEDTSRAASFVLDNDEPAVLLGEDNGANPVEYVLHALAGCLTTSLVYHAAARDIDVEAVESRLEGTLDLRGFLGISDDVRNGYNQVKVTFTIEGDLTQEEAEELGRMGAGFSPVFDIVTNPVPVAIEVERR
jgi:uncharacterized OsmC-like protein